jgi:hypothetical protein
MFMLLQRFNQVRSRRTALRIARYYIRRFFQVVYLLGLIALLVMIVNTWF